MISASSILKFLHLATQQDLNPWIENGEGKFTIHYHYPDRYRNEQIVIDEKDSEDINSWDSNDFRYELEYLIEREDKKRKDSQERERQQILDKLSDREKELLGLS